jgi:hypothetical protein
MISLKSKIFGSVIALTLIFNLLFWHEKLGVNLLLFIFLLTIAAFVLNKDSIKSKNAMLVMLALLYSCGMVIYNNSIFSSFACISSFIVLVGYIHQPEMKTVLSALFTSLGSFSLFPYNVLEETRLAKNRFRVFAKVLKAVKLGFIPVIVFFVFYGIYAYANPIFNNYSNSFWDWIKQFLNQLLIDYPPERFIFIFFGLFIITGVLFNRNVRVFLKIDKSFLGELIRDKYKKLVSRIDDRFDYGRMFKRIFKFKMNSLKTEYKTGVILIILVNFLILILNIIDISFVWFGFDSSRVDNLAYFVHEGTYYLIFSILLSMAILLYFFRGNLNFYSKNSLLKYGAYLWITQNGIMAISLILRNYYYIEYYYALSYKRIGVMIFILLTFIGLVTMFIKISGRKTIFYLLKVNGAAIFVVMILMGSLNWDENIAKFNLQNPDKRSIDVEYLFSLSDDVLPVLDEHKELLNQNFYFREGWRRYQNNGLEELKTRVRNFLDSQNGYTWLSWNYTDWKNRQYFTNYFKTSNSLKNTIF